MQIVVSEIGELIEKNVDAMRYVYTPIIAIPVSALNTFLDILPAVASRPTPYTCNDINTAQSHGTSLVILDSHVTSSEKAEARSVVCVMHH